MSTPVVRVRQSRSCRRFGSFTSLLPGEVASLAQFSVRCGASLCYNLPVVSNDGAYQTLGRKTLSLFVAERIAPALVIFLVAAVTLISSGSPRVAGALSLLHLKINLEAIALFGFLASAVAAGAAVLVAWLVYTTYRFSLGEDALKIKRGVFSQEEIAIPYRQIQDVTIDQPFSFRLMGLSEIAILTAGHEEAGDVGESEGLLPALDRYVAENLRDELLRRAEVQKVVNEPAKDR